MARAAEDPLQVGAYQASVEQEQLRTQTKRLMADMNRMLDEFRGNPAATDEVALTEATIKKLQSLSETEMASVVAALREASSSKTGNTADKVLAANKTARDVQSALVLLADRLALFKDEGSVELRLTGLIRRQIAAQRQTKYLFDGTTDSKDLARDSELAASEQKGIKDDLDSLLQSLQKLATNPASTGRTVFAGVMIAGSTASITPNSEAAHGLVSTKNFPGAVTAQGMVTGGLQAMLLALNSSKTLEERLRTAEAQMRLLAAKEDLLARTTTKTSVEIQRTVAKRQAEIADQRTMLEAEVAQLNPATTPVLGQARQAMDNLDSDLRKNRGLIGSADKKLEVVNTQNGVAGNFRQLAEMLKKQADMIAAASSGSSGDASQQALADAASSVQAAINKMESAENLIGQGGDTDSAKKQIDDAKGNIDDATKALGDAGTSAPPSAGKDLGESKDSLDKGGNEATKDAGGPGRNQANADVGHAKGLAAKVLSDLQQAMAAAAANSTGMLAGSQANGSNPSTGQGSGAGWGGLFHHDNQSSAYSALAKVSEQDRQALMMVQQEKAPPEYSGMAEQYLKNLAEGAVPAR